MTFTPDRRVYATVLSNAPAERTNRKPLEDRMPCQFFRLLALFEMEEIYRREKVGAMTPLARAIATYVVQNGDKDGFHPSPLDGLAIGRVCEPSMPLHVASVPSLCIVAQGAKSSTHEMTTCNYTAMQFVLIPIDMPLVSAVTTASDDEPFYGMILDLDLSTLLSVAAELELSALPSEYSGPARLRMYDLGEELADALRRLIELLHRPQIAKILFSASMREICLWLLTSTNGKAISGIAASNGVVVRLSTAISAMRGDLARPLRLTELAAIAQMSVSTFHTHFSSLTGMTPMQFQKQLRLIEARRLMLNDYTNVSETALRVGYESPSHFSRDYTRKFGVSPRHDALAPMSASP